MRRYFSVEVEIREHQTPVSGGLDKAAFYENVDHVFEDYSDAYLWQSKFDVTKCRPQEQY